MDVFTVSFFGHRQINNPAAVSESLEKIVRELLFTKEYVEFLVGRNGEFDRLAASAVHRCKRTVRDDNSALVLVLPYMTAEFRSNEASFLEYFDEIEVFSDPAANHFKSAYQARNRSMIDRSSLVIFFVEHKSGGAYQTMKYAAKSNMPCINLFDNKRLSF